MYKTYVKNPTPYRKSCYTKFRNHLTNVIHSVKRKFYSEKFNNLRGNLNKTWKLINNILRRQNTAIGNSVFQDDTGRITDPKQIAEGFNTFFVNIGNSIANSAGSDDTTTSFRMYLEDSVAPSAFFKPITVKEICDIALNLKDNKAPGYDAICARVVKKIIHIICKPLCNIFNECINAGIVPQELKIAKVIPIFKKGKKDVFSNYRPISLLPLFSKIF